MPSTLQEWCNNPFPVMFWAETPYTSDASPGPPLGTVLFTLILLITLAVNHFGCPGTGQSLGHCTPHFARHLKSKFIPKYYLLLSSHSGHKIKLHSGQPCETLCRKRGWFGILWALSFSPGSSLPSTLILHPFYMQIYLYLIALQFFLFLWYSKINKGTENP